MNAGMRLQFPTWRSERAEPVLIAFARGLDLPDAKYGEGRVFVNVEGGRQALGLRGTQLILGRASKELEMARRQLFLVDVVPQLQAREDDPARLVGRGIDFEMLAPELASDIVAHRDASGGRFSQAEKPLC